MHSSSIPSNMPEWMRRPNLPASSRQEFRQKFHCLSWILFGEEVTSVDGLSLDIVGPVPPDSQRAAVLLVERIERAAGGPQMQHRAAYLSGLLAIFFVVL